jgi:hypothetical protein
MEAVATSARRKPWNKGKIVGQKAPFKLKELTRSSKRRTAILSRLCVQRTFCGQMGVALGRMHTKTQTWKYASAPAIMPTALMPKTAFSSHLRLVSSAIAAMAMAICNAVVAWAQRWCWCICASLF